MKKRLVISILLFSLIFASLAAGCSRSQKPKDIPTLPYTFPMEICHATGSESNSYVLITINSEAALNGHLPHEGDKIPAPTDGCSPVEIDLEPTWTFTPVPTSTFTPTVTSTPEPTNTPTLPPTATFTPTISPNTDFISVEGPLSGTIKQCANEYTAEVTDSDGLAFVRVEFFLNSTTDPDMDGFYNLAYMGDNIWSNTLIIETSLFPGPDTVYWRFWAEDNQGNTVYSPAVSFFDFVDDADCSGGT